MMSISNIKKLSIFLFGLPLSGIALGQDNVDTITEKNDEQRQTKEKTVTKLNLNIDTSNWKCKYCPDNEDEPWFIDIESGLGYVSNDSYKFGEYNGLHKEGPFIILDIDAMYRDENANYFDIKTQNLGLEIRTIDMEGGRQGKFKVNVLIDNINRYQLDTSRTPYNGTSTQTLPSTWVRGSTTGGMTSLASDLHTIQFYSKRQKLNLSGNYIQNKKWNYDIKFDRQTKQGQTPFAVALGTVFANAKSVILSKPIDYTTDNIKLAANYNHQKTTASISVSHSTFKNKNDSIVWDNAYSTTPDSGEIALEPDNQMQQFMANAQYRGIDDFIISGFFSYSKLEQNDSFNPYSNNSALTPTALPAESLAGNVDVYNFNANVNWSVTNKSKIKFIYEHQEHSNNTKRATYSYVIADTALTATPRANFPYSFRNKKLKVNASYRLEDKNKITGGVEYALFNKTYQSVQQSTKSSVWSKYTQKLSSDVNYSLKFQGDIFKTDSYQQVSELNPTENPQLRKYNLADRDEIRAIFNINFLALSQLFMNLNVEYSNNDYTNSAVGLREGNELSLGVDAQYSFGEDIIFTAYFLQSTMSSIQNGSTIAGNPDWVANNTDSFLTIGLGADYSVIEDEFSLGFNFIHADAKGEVAQSGVTVTPLPDVTSLRDSLSIYGNYHYDENMTFKLSYDYEVYQEKNWNLDSVTQGTIDNVLTLGEISPNYKIGVIWASMKYLF